MIVRMKIVCVWNAHIRKRAFISSWLLYFLYLRRNKIIFICSMPLETNVRWITYSTFINLSLRLYFISLKTWFVRWLSIKWHLHFFVHIFIKRLICFYFRWGYKSWFVSWNTLKFYRRSIWVLRCFFLSENFFRVLIIHFFELVSFILIFIRTDS
jgi:hypothetical protein